MNYERIIVALDFSSKEEALKVVDNLGELINFYKVGLELFLSAGTEILTLLKEREKKIFLDLKFHDIPNTVSKAVEASLKYGVDMLTIHASSGYEALKRAVDRVKELESDVKIIGVTVLTSLDSEALRNIFGLPLESTQLVKNLANLSKSAGLSGVVASPNEVGLIKECCGEDFLVITPGIRAKRFSGDDQQRTATLKEALSQGADYVVVGRAITKSEKPKEALLELL